MSDPKRRHAHQHHRQIGPCHRSDDAPCSASPEAIRHYRDSNGKEIDAIITLPDGRWGAVEVKLGGQQFTAGADTLRAAIAHVDTAAIGEPAFRLVVTGTGPILVTDDGEPRAKLMDFGVARLTDGAALTAPGDVVGTLAYMAPEQAEGRTVGPEADVYSLALMLYECWAGHNPNRRATPAATARAIGARPRPLSPFGRP